MSGDFAFMMLPEAPQYSAAGRPGFADNDNTV